MPVYFDCTDKEAFADLRKQYSVSGFPCVVFIDPAGKELKKVVGAKPLAEFTGAIDTVSKKYPGRPTFWNNTLKSATAAARAGKKKVALYVAHEKADPIKATAGLTKGLGDRKTKLAWAWELGTEKFLEIHNLESAPAILIYATGEKEEDRKLLGKVTIKEGDDAKLMNDAIDEILKNAK